MRYPHPFMRVVVSLSLLASAALVASEAHAAGFYLGDIGTRGMARGGAFVASPDSLLALHYNPAGLAKLRGFHAEGSLSFVGMEQSFLRRCPCVIDNPNAAELDAALEARYDTPVNSNTSLEIPFVGVGYGLDWLDTTIAIGAWGPNSGRHDYGELPDPRQPDFASVADTMPNRYSGITMRTIEANFALGAGFRPFKGIKWAEGLTVGLVLMGYQSGNNQTVHLWPNTDLILLSPEDASADIPVVFKFNQAFDFNWGLGVSYEVIPGLSIGSSFRAKRTIDTGGTIDVSLPRRLLNPGGDPIAVVQGNEVQVRLATAPIVRTGIEYVMPKVFRAEASFVWEGWSAQDQIEIDASQIQIDILGMPQELGQIIAPRGWQDTWSLRVGGELNLWEPWIGLQAGYWYEPSGIPEERVDPSRVDFDKHGATFGLSTTMYGTTLALGFQYVKLASTQVRTSQQIQIAPLDGAQELLTNVGNGDYRSQYFVGSVSLAFSLDALSAE